MAVLCRGFWSPFGGCVSLRCWVLKRIPYLSSAWNIKPLLKMQMSYGDEWIFRSVQMSPESLRFFTVDLFKLTLLLANVGELQRRFMSTVSIVPSTQRSSRIQETFNKLFHEESSPSCGSQYTILHKSQ